MTESATNMNEEIRINGFLKSLKIEILENTVRIARKSALKYLEFEIDLEDFSHRKTVKSEINRDLIGLSLLLFVFGFFANIIGVSLALPICWGISFCCLIIGLFTKVRTITIESNSGQPIVLRYTKNSEREIREFSDLLITKSKNYIICKYSKVDRDLPVDNQLYNIEYLRNNNLISDSRFEELKNIILNKKAVNKTIGFEQ